MSQHAVLDNASHLDLRIHTEAGAKFGDETMACLTVPYEFREVQGHFPILFRRDIESGRFTALALFGFDMGENLFLSADRWEARYKPWALAIQPFLVGRPADGDGPAQVHIDLDHPRISHSGEGTRLFEEDGRPTPYLEHAAALLGMLDEGYRASADFYSALQRHELLEPFSLEISLEDGSQNSLVGYHIVDEAKLRALDAAALEELHRAGHLMPIFMALASLSQIGELVRRKNRKLAHG